MSDVGCAPPDLTNERHTQGPGDNCGAIAILDCCSSCDEISQVDGQIQQTAPRRVPTEGNRFDGGIDVARFENGLAHRPQLGDCVVQFDATRLQMGR